MPGDATELIADVQRWIDAPEVYELTLRELWGDLRVELAKAIVDRAKQQPPRPEDQLKFLSMHYRAFNNFTLLPARRRGSR